ncbi:MAG: 50S ribosomal protein L13 [Candidatus Omnitrophota bacterium]
MKTFMQKKTDLARKWYLVDATDAILGRFSGKIAKILMGKDKATYTPNVDMADFVVVINAAKIRVTGKKMSQKYYSRYSGYPDGLKKESLEHLLKRKPEQVILHAVKGMLPKNRLAKRMLNKLKVYSDNKHPHIAQEPVSVNL